MIQDVVRGLYIYAQEVVLYRMGGVRMLFVALILVLAASCTPAHAAPLSAAIETRYCYAPSDVPRYKSGTIKRSLSVRDAFQRLHPCPATGKPEGACLGWSVDHVIPLVCGGCDSVSNMQWLPNEIKSSADSTSKDRWERPAYCQQ